MAGRNNPFYYRNPPLTDVSPDVGAPMGGNSLINLGRAMVKVSSKMQQNENSQLAQQGAQQGAIDGATGAPVKIEGNSPYAVAHQKAAQDTYMKRIELNGRAKKDELAAKYPSDPAMLQTELETYQKSISSTIDDPYVKSMFELGFGGHAQHAITLAKTKRGQIVQQEHRAASLEVQTKRTNSHSQLMRAAGGGDQEALSLSEIERNAVLSDLLANGPATPFKFDGQDMEPGTGAYSIDQIAKIMGDMDTEGAHQAILGSWDAGPKSQDWIDSFYKGQIPGVSQDGKDQLRAVMEGDLAQAVKLDEKIAREDEKATKVYHEQVYAAAFAGIADGATTRYAIDALLAQRKIEGSQAVTLYRAVDAIGATSDDPAAVAQLYDSLDTGHSIKADAMSFYTEGHLTKATLDKFRAAEDGRGRETADVGQYRSFVREAIVTAGPMAVLDPDTSYRRASATQEYNDRTGNGEDPALVANDVVTRYRLQAPGPTAYPSPRFLQGSRADLHALETARKATAQAFQDGKISPSEARAEAETIRKLMDFANQAQQQSIPTGGRK